MAKSRTVLNSPASMRRRQPSGVLPIKFQGPRTEDRGPRPSNLGPEAIGSGTEDRAPRSVVLGTRPSIGIPIYVIL
jgi:hypothetical protein